VFALNQDLIERADCTPDTVVTLVDGTKYIIAESLADLVELIREFRVSIITDAQHLERRAVSRSAARAETGPPPTASVLPMHRREP
jgi:flagellar protein FlbD